jgi:hypothetical protein
MAFLQNQSPRTIRWRTFNYGAGNTLIGAAEGVLTPGAATPYTHPRGAFDIEIREPAAIPFGRVITPASGPFTNTDTLTFTGQAVVRTGQPVRLAGDTGFRPSRHGFLFCNAFPRNLPHLTLDVLGTTRGVFDAGMGLCGGMVHAAIDYHGTLTRPAVAHVPATGALFDYLCRRLMDSFNVPGGVLRYLHLMSPQRTPAERARAMILDEWPRIRAFIDSGIPAPMALVLVESADWFDLGQNHQVLAYAYELLGNALTLHLYDPNHDPQTAGGDDLRLSLSLSGPNALTPVSAPWISRPVLAFFRTEYTRQLPPAAAQVPSSEPPQRPQLALGGRGWVEGNGHLGLIEFSPRRADGTFNGQVYGQPINGCWQGEQVEFTRTLGPNYTQVWSGRERSDGSLVGSFVERVAGGGPGPRYGWRAHAALMVDGNGWPGALTLDTFFGNGDFVGTVYGQPARGRWDAARQTLGFVRDGGAGYSQEWSATRSYGLDFDGTFQERVQGTLKPERYRWIGRLRQQLRDTVRLINRHTLAVSGRCYAPDDAVRAVPLMSFSLAPGEQKNLTIPLGLPLALTHMALVFDHGPTALAGYGDDLAVEFDGSVTPL